MAGTAKSPAKRKASKKVEAEQSPAFIAYKGFDKDLRCRDFQFKIGGTYKHDGKVVRCAAGGFHGCDHPFDVWGYYPITDDAGNTQRFAEIEVRGAIDRTDAGDTKFAAAEIHIKAELTLPAFIKRGVDYLLAQVDWKNAKESNTGYQSAATNTGYRSAATNTGNRSAATNTGYQSAATNTGYRSAATNTGNQSAATNTGYRSAATNTGDQSAATNTGNRSAATNTGDQSAATNTGKFGVAAATGFEGRASGANGCALFLVERLDKWNHDDHGKILHVWSGIVGQDGIEPDTYYTLRDGKPVSLSSTKN